MPLERLTMLVMQPDGRPTLVVPRLEQSAAQAAPGVEAGLVDLVTWTETEDPIRNVALALRDGAAQPGAELLVSDSLRAAFLLKLQAGIPTARFGLASTVTSPLRQIKDAEEIELLRVAAHAADRTVRAISPGGWSAARRRTSRARSASASSPRATTRPPSGIVASGPNSASPHHGAGDRVIEAGEPIVLDIGGQHRGLPLGHHAHGLGDRRRRRPRPRRHVPQPLRVLYRAQAAARAAIAPGVPCEAIDRTARDIIDAAGYGEQFFHRTGHGIGLDGHEDPYLVAGNAAPLAVGNAFSVEPGIYLEGATARASRTSWSAARRRAVTDGRSNSNTLGAARPQLAQRQRRSELPLRAAHARLPRDPAGSYPVT